MLPGDPRLATNRQRNAYRDELEQLLKAKLVGIGEDYRGVASPIKLSRTLATYRSEPPRRDG
jgi:hypothetical protein